MKLLVKKIHPKAITLKQSKPGDAGYDLFATEDVVVPSLFSVCVNWLKACVFFQQYKTLWDEKLDGIFATKIKTGVCVSIPANHVGLIWDRSSVGQKLIKVFGGVIDSTYTGEIMVCLTNFSFHDYHIKAGDKIAQMVIQEYKSFEIEEVEELEQTERGDGGFGSTGR